MYGWRSGAINKINSQCQRGWPTGIAGATEITRLESDTARMQAWSAYRLAKPAGWSNNGRVICLINIYGCMWVMISIEIVLVDDIASLQDTNKKLNIITNTTTNGAVHKVCHAPEGGGGVWESVTVCDRGGGHTFNFLTIHNFTLYFIFYHA